MREILTTTKATKTKTAKNNDMKSILIKNTNINEKFKTRQCMHACETYFSFSFSILFYSLLLILIFFFFHFSFYFFCRTRHTWPYFVEIKEKVTKRVACLRKLGCESVVFFFTFFYWQRAKKEKQEMRARVKNFGKSKNQEKVNSAARSEW